MCEMQPFSALVGDIYDASLDPALWPEVFEKSCRFIGGSAAALASRDVVSRNTTVFYSWGYDPHYERLYLDKYSKINPFYPMAHFFDIEEVHAPVPECLPRDEFCRSLLAREWLAPQGFVDGLYANLEKSPTGCAALWVFRHFNDGFVDDEMRRRFAAVVPHVRRALAIGRVVDLKTIEAAALADSLDTLPSAMFLVDATGRIVHANLRAHAMVSEAGVVRAGGGKLRANHPHGDQALLDAFTAAGSGDAALGRKGIAVPLQARDGTRYVANLLPLTSGARRKAGACYAAVATVFVHKAALDLPSPPELIAKEFQLTPAELRVLFAIIEVGNVPEVAAVLGLSQATVKTHLHRLFEKTGTHRQAELVKLVAGYSHAVLH
jgi:DNA-binding CsgD family transcriptional regulator/PAS domain-containing protein